MNTICKAICVIMAVMIAGTMAGCIEHDEFNDQSVINDTDVASIVKECRLLTTDYVDAIDNARDEYEHATDLSFDDWDTKTDDLWQSSESDKDDLWTEYISDDDMTYETYSAKFDAIDNRYIRQFGIFDKELDRAYEDERQIYLDTKDELSTDYEDSVDTLIDSFMQRTYE